jgi:hypothetical protein
MNASFRSSGDHVIGPLNDSSSSCSGTTGSVPADESNTRPVSGKGRVLAHGDPPLTVGVEEPDLQRPGYPILPFARSPGDDQRVALAPDRIDPLPHVALAGSVGGGDEDVGGPLLAEALESDLRPVRRPAGGGLVGVWSRHFTPVRAVPIGDDETRAVEPVESDSRTIPFPCWNAAIVAPSGAQAGFQPPASRRSLPVSELASQIVPEPSKRIVVGSVGDHAAVSSATGSPMGVIARRCFPPASTATMCVPAPAWSRRRR